MFDGPLLPVILTFVMLLAADHWLLMLHDSGVQLTIPFTSSYLDNAPSVDAKHELSPKDKAALDRSYMPKAA